MRVLVLNYEFPPVGGGGGHVAQDLCRVLAARGHEIRVQTALVKGLPRIEWRDGYTIYRTFAFRRRADRCTVPEMGGYILTNLLPSLRHVWRWKPDLIHVHFAVPTGVVAWFVNRLTGLPYVLTAHLGDVPGAMPEQTDQLYKIFKPFTYPIWRRAAAVTAVSDYIRRVALLSYDVPIETLNNGIDMKSGTPESPAPHQPVRMVFAGRFDPQKNVPLLVDLLARVKDLDWQFEMVGDGPHMPVVQEKVQQYGLADRLHLHGWVDPARVDEIMSECDILTLVSSFEGMPVVAVMALGHGLAILGTDIGGLLDVVEDGVNGFLRGVNDLDTLEEALRIMLTDTDRLEQMRRASCQIARRFDLDEIVSRYEAIFQEVGRCDTPARA